MFGTEENDKVFKDFLQDAMPIIVKLPKEEYEKRKMQCLKDAEEYGSENVLYFLRLFFIIAEDKRSVVCYEG